MAEPKKRLTSTRSGNRQSHDRVKKTNLSVCSNCKQPVRPHNVCQNCGFYNGKKVIEVSKDVAKNKKIEEELKDE